MIVREVVTKVQKGLDREQPLIQVITGPRQVGKTTAAKQIVKEWPHGAHFVSADQPQELGSAWITAQWQLAARLATESGPALLVLDEIQKIQGWAETIKALWDAEAGGRRVFPLVLGSSALLLGRGLGESLAGRFLLHRCGHWSFAECSSAFGWNFDEWVFFGGYPGAAAYRQEEDLWRSYVRDSLIETVIGRDILQLQTVHKPALLRNLFVLAAAYPAQILSYTKMLGHLQDAGNTTTLAHYVKLLETAFLLSGLENYAGAVVRQRGSSPKLVLWNNALVTALGIRSFDQALQDRAGWGRLVENAVGGRLADGLQEVGWQLTSWRHRGDEVDYVVQGGGRLWAIEVKSGVGAPRGLEKFCKVYPEAVPVLVGPGGIPLEEFCSSHVAKLLTSIG